MDIDDRKEALAHMFSIMFGVDMDNWQLDACLDMVKGRSAVGKLYQLHSEPNADELTTIDWKFTQYSNIAPKVYTL